MRWLLLFSFVFDYESWNHCPAKQIRHFCLRLFDHEPWNHIPQVIEGGTCDNCFHF